MGVDDPWIAYQWVPEHGQGRYLMRPDGNNAHEIATELPGEAYHPDWSPDGKRIAFDNATVGIAEAPGFAGRVKKAPAWWAEAFSNCRSARVSRKGRDEVEAVGMVDALASAPAGAPAVQRRTSWPQRSPSSNR